MTDPHAHLRAAQINASARPWAIIDSGGRFGDEIVAGYLSERDALICLAALQQARAYYDAGVAG